MTEQKANAAIFYEVDGFKTTGERLLGRQAAGESFLKGFTRAMSGQTLYCYADHPQKFETFQQQVADYAGKTVPTGWISPLSLQKMAEPGCLFYSGPGLEDMAWQRRYISPSHFSICGITHTTCSKEAMTAFGGLLTGPLEEWDALICTSQSAKQTAQRTMERYGEYLSRRAGGQFEPRLQLPVIPLGINCDDFEKTTESDAYAKAFREQYQIEDDAIVFLYVGRLASHAKAHPLPMYQALEKAAEQTSKKIHLIQAGWFANTAIEQQFKAGAQTFCPSVTCHFIDGRDLQVRRHIWFVADIFTSLSDNIQETFGITPVEAMAAGLPVVVTDWDGYRETVRGGVDGFFVRTTMPSPGSGLPLAYRYHSGVDHYDRYVGQVSLFTHVDSQHCAQQYLRLIEDADLRRDMGQSGKVRARTDFDWSSLVPRYQDLWGDLQSRRQAALPILEKDKSLMPLMDDPFVSFEHYSTESITSITEIALVDGAAERLLTVLNDPLGNGVHHLLPKVEKLQAILNHLEDKGPDTIGNIARFFDLKPKAMILYAGWLAKTNLVLILRQQAD